MPNIMRTTYPLILLLLLGAAACEEDQVLTTTRNLNRPGPLALVCAGRGGDGGAATGLSASRCTSDAGTVKGVKGTLYGFVANTAKGEVAVFRPGATSSIDLLVDLDKGSPGYGFIPVGIRPTDLVASKNGCTVVTANSGSCDLALIDVPAVMDVAASIRKQPSGSLVSRLKITTPSGRPLRARPQAVMLVPSTDKPKAKDTDSCVAQPGLRAYVTFPSCNLLAEVDLTTGKMLQGLVLHANGTVSRNDEPGCAAECVLSGDNKLVDMGTRDVNPPNDAGPSDLNVSHKGVLPHGMALQTLSTTDSRIYVSSAGAGFVWAIDLKAGKFQLTAQKVVLEGGPSTTRLKLSPEPLNPKTGRYLYTIASDRTVRVISLAKTQPRECDTQIDLTLVTEKKVDLDKAGCFVVSDATRKLRKVTASGPGLPFGDRVPLDIEFVNNPMWKTDAVMQDTRAHTTPLQGIYAMISVSDGLVYVIDVEDWTVVKKASTEVPRLRLPHRRRNLYLGGIRETPDASITSVSGASSGGVPVLVNKVTSGGSTTTVPGQGLLLRAPGEATTSDWLMTYEERLVARWSGSLSLEKGELIFRDKGAKYCHAGVEARKLSKGRPERHGDLLILVGCKSDGDCGLGQECIKAIGNPSEYGLCLEKGREDDLYTQCLPFFSANREFVIKEAKDNQLKLEMLPELPARLWDTKASNCKSNADCPDEYLCALKAQSATGLKQGDCFRSGCRPKVNDPAMRSDDCNSKHRCVKPLDNSSEKCTPVPRPIETLAGTCTTDAQCDPNQMSPKPAKLNASCGSNSDCGGATSLLECRKSPITSVVARCLPKGMTCQPVGKGGAKVCARVMPCFNQLMRYDIRAGRSFTIGGFKRQVANKTTGLCEDPPDTVKSPLFNNRLYIGQPVFPAAVGQECKPGDVKHPSTPSPNACYEVRTGEGYQGVDDVLSDTTYSTASDSPPTTVLRFANPEIWFSMGVSHLAKQSSTKPDAGVSGSVVPPMPTRNMTMRLALGSGFFPLRSGSTSAISLPVHLVSAPDGYLYLVDMGDRPGSTGTNGQVLRLTRNTVLLDNFAVK